MLLCCMYDNYYAQNYAGIIRQGLIYLYHFAGAEQHRIRRLPGVTGSVNFEMYSGFITVNETYMTKSFYWYV